MADYRRFIKINGKTLGSPRFPTQKQADEWYREREEERDKVKQGRKSGHVPTFMEWTAQWVRQLIAEYEKPTWQGYESNLRLHLLPYLKDYRMDQITRAKCREVLMLVTRNGYSANHRKHVQATLSKIFTDAMNTEPPIVESNPVYRMKYDGKRQGKTHAPTFLETEEEVLEFLQAARALSDTHFVLACIGLMAGLRKQEIIALRWRHVRWRKFEIRVMERFRQAMNTIDTGTKAGEGVYHDVVVSETLIETLKAYRGRTSFRGEDDFILSKPDGSYWPSREFHDLFVEIREKVNRPDLTPHSMRHTYGRLFQQKTGNTRVLQKQLGHSSMATTAIYSALSTEQVRPFAETISFKVSDTADTADTKTTPKSGAQ